MAQASKGLTRGSGTPQKHVSKCPKGDLRSRQLNVDACIDISAAVDLSALRNESLHSEVRQAQAPRDRSESRGHDSASAHGRGVKITVAGVKCQLADIIDAAFTICIGPCMRL